MNLAEKFKEYINDEVIPVTIPGYISNNLNPQMELRYYQKEAISLLKYYYESYKQREYPTHLLYQMATGSGKTLIMAASMLYLYGKGYRNFIFFVNNTNIIEKTKDNFLSPIATKYLFAEKIIIEDLEVRIRPLENFEDSNDTDINVWFTTIQGLHSKLNEIRENSFTIEDINDKNIVLISDEAHHINALTKLKSESLNDNLFGDDISDYTGLGKEEAEALKTWESSVNKIFKQNENNILLEFTATLELNNPNIEKKYDDKIIYNYDLAQFRIDGYSKNIDILSEDMPPIDRALTSLLLSQYRLKIAEHNGLKIKPVILFKSKTIIESEAFYNEFHDALENLTVNDLINIKERNFNNIVKDAFEFFDQKNISLQNLLTEIIADFEQNKTIVVNSKAESEEKQRLLNTLEDDNNQIRAIFAVDKLNEGWDVLNLFDIVRLYETRDTRSNKPGSYTIAEAQLIGRGARYNPFDYNDRDKFKRKFDDGDNELAVLEVLHYHSRSDSKYISELRKALIQTGITPDEKDKKTLRISPNFKETNLWKYGLVFSNERVLNDFSGNQNFEIMSIKRDYHKEYYTYKTEESSLLSDKYSLSSEQSKVPVIDKKIINLFDKNLIRFAMNFSKFYKFNNLQIYFPYLESIDEFLTDDNYIGYINLTIKGIQNIKDLPRKIQLKFAKEIFKELENDIKSKSFKYKGKKEFKPRAINKVFHDKDLYFDRRKFNKKVISTRTYEWFAFDSLVGTREEESFLTFFAERLLPILEEKFKDIYLIRNERFIAIYNFTDGAGFEPDFLLFAKDNKNNKQLMFQIFIEPKGKHIEEHDKWKENLLLKLKDINEINPKIFKEEQTFGFEESLDKNPNYRILGLPFFSSTKEINFLNLVREIS